MTPTTFPGDAAPLPKNAEKTFDGLQGIGFRPAHQEEEDSINY